MSSSANLLKQGDTTFQQRRYAEATDLFEQAAALADTENNTQLLVEALSMVARGFLIRDKKEQGREWLEKAKAKANPREPLGWSRYLGVRGRFEWKDDDNETATATFREMYAFCVEYEQHSRAVDAAHMVGIVGSPDEQITWAMKGIKAAEKGELDGWLGPLWNNLGATYDNIGDYQKALDAYLKARHYHWKVGDEQAKLVADWAVGKTYRRIGQHDESLQWLRPVLAWAERRYAEESSVERGEWVGLVSWDLGEIAAVKEESKEALELLNRAKELLKAAGMPDWDPKSWNAINERIDELRK